MNFGYRMEESPRIAAWRQGLGRDRVAFIASRKMARSISLVGVR